MAKKQVATVEVFCNAKQAVQILNEYKRLAADTLTKIEQKTQRVNQIRAKGTNATKAEVAEMKKLTQELKKDEQAFRMYNSAVQKGIDSHVKLRNVMKDLSGSKLKDLKMAMRELQKMMQNVSNDTPKRAKVIQASMQKVQAQITKLTGETGKFGAKHSSVWQTAVRNITAYVGVFGSITALKRGFDEFIAKNREFSDQMANVRKVSNLAMEDIGLLAKSLAQIDSRTSLQGLMELSYTGAKLGFGEYGPQGLEAFAKSAVKVQNALSEDMGSEALTQLSKMVEVMGLIPKMGVERAMDATGSAIFKLASTSTATGTNIVEFSKRLMGLANIAHISTADLLAFGSAADSMALMPEVAATAFNKMITAVQKQPNLIENALNIPSGTISNLYQAGQMTEALVTIFNKMREKGGMNALMHSGVFKDLGSDGARLVAVMATMANRVDILNKHIATSREAFSDGTAVAKEYEIQMDTAAAYAERASNIFEKAFVNPEGVDVVKDLSKAWYEFAKSMTESEKVMFGVKISLQGIILLIKGLLRILPELAFTAMVGGISAMIARMRELGGVLAVTTGLFGKLSVAQKAFLKTAGWVGLAIAIYEVGKAIYDLQFKAKTTNEYLRGFKNDLSDLEKQFGGSVEEVNRYKRAIEQAGDGTKTRAAAIREFNNKFGQYMSNMLSEKATALEVAKAYDQVVKSMRTKLAMQLKEKDVQEYVLPREQWTADKREAYVKSIKGTRFSEYGREWISGFAEDNRNVPIEKVFDKLAKIFKPQGNYNTFAGWQNILSGSLGSESEMLAMLGRGTNQQQMYLAMRYILQKRGAENAMRKVNDKWAPEQKAMDEMLADQQTPDIYPELENAPDKEALKAAKAAAAEQRRKEAQARRERLQQLRNELKDAEQESQAIIDKINEFYYLQEETIEQQVADGKITRAIADQYLKELKLSKNQTLANARKAIVGKMSKDDWDKYAKAELQRVMIDQGEWSSELASDIMKTDLTYIHNLLARFDGSESVLGLRSTASFDKLMKNAAVNERDNARIRAQIAEDVEKVLAEYNYVEQAQKSFHGNLIALGIMRETYEQYAKRMQEEAKALAKKDGQSAGDVAWDLSLPGAVVLGKYKSPEEQLLQQFLSQGSKPYRVNPQSDRDLYVWLKNLMSNYDYDEEDDFMGHTEKWVQKGFPQLEEWVKDIDKYRPEIQKFYFSLITWEDEYYDAKKKAYDRSKRLMEQEWDRSGNKQRYDDLEWELAKRGRERKMPGYDQGTTFEQMGGFDALEEDPELAVYRAKIEASQLYLQQLQQEHADELLIREAQRAESEAEMAYQEQIMSRINERISKLHEWTGPVVQMGEQVGQALYDQWHNGESMTAKWQDMLKDLGMAWGKTTIKIVEELMMQRVKQSILNRAMEADQLAHQSTMAGIEQTGGAAKIAAQTATNTVIETNEAAHNAAMLAEDTGAAAAETPVNISRAAGKTLAGLGWWGIPLVAVIVTLLTTLLNAALGKSKRSSDKSTSSNSAAEKMKLVSGMLTYDEGNVSSYVGTDGHVYNARRAAMPQGTAIVTSPIATSINGQPSLVAERGPEIVIGRRTTRHIMLNEPALLQHLADLDRRRATRYRPFDEGNLSTLSPYVAVSQQPSSQSAHDEQMEQTLAALTAAVVALQARLSQPIKAEINKYGTGGLIDEVQSGLKFMGKYGK